VTLLFGPVLTYNVLLTLGLGLSACTAYLAIGRYVSSRIAAVLGRLVYGFSPYMRAHSLGHVNLTLVFLPPLLLLLLDDVVVRQRRTPLLDGALLGVMAVCQLLISEEVLATTALTGALLLVVLAVGHWRQVRSHLSYAAAAFAVAAVVFLVLAAVPLASQFFGPYRHSGPASGAAPRLVNDLYTFVVPSRQQVVSPRRPPIWSPRCLATPPSEPATWERRCCWSRLAWRCAGGHGRWCGRPRCWRSA